MLKSFCTAKHTTNNLWYGKTFANYISDKRLTFNTYKELIQLSNKKTNDLIKKWAKDLNRHFSREDKRKANRSMKRCWISLVTRDVTSLMSVRMAITKSDDKCWWGCAEKGTLVHCGWECKLVQSLWKTVWRILKQLQIELPYDPTIHFWDYIQR